MIPAAIFFGLAANSFQKNRHALPQPVSKERELLSAIRDNGGSITPAEAAMETSLTVREADGMLSELAGGGHLAVQSRDGALFYALPGGAVGRSKAGTRAIRFWAVREPPLPRYLPVNFASRFSKNALTPSLWSCV